MSDEHSAEKDALEVRCPDCGVDAMRLPPCRICGYVNGCCPCYHADDTTVNPSAVTPAPEDSLTVEWGVRYPSGAVQSYGDDEAAARRFALATTSLRPDLPTLVVRQVVTRWECPTPPEENEKGGDE